LFRSQSHLTALLSLLKHVGIFRFPAPPSDQMLTNPPSLRPYRDILGRSTA
jgi:hypothetical protein